MTTENTNEEKIFKLNHSNVRGQINENLAENLKKFNDPVVLGEIVYLLKEERENTNRILKTLLTKIETLEMKLSEMQKTKEEATNKTLERTEHLLPEIDAAIVSFLAEGPKSAENVQKRFGYKGKNAASARLNRLHDSGVVIKKQVGKKVFFLLA